VASVDPANARLVLPRRHLFSEETGGAAHGGSFGEAWLPPTNLTMRRKRAGT
jgi:hypothetical protein